MSLTYKIFLENENATPEVVIQVFDDGKLLGGKRFLAEKLDATGVESHAKAALNEFAVKKAEDEARVASLAIAVSDVKAKLAMLLNKEFSLDEKGMPVEVIK